MPLPVRPPIEPMLAKLARSLPEGDWCFEPKWGGFRCLAFLSGGEVDLRSRNDRPLARYFPGSRPTRCVASSGRRVAAGRVPASTLVVPLADV